MIKELSKLIIKDLFGCLSATELTRLSQIRSELKIDDEAYRRIKQQSVRPEICIPAMEPAKPRGGVGDAFSWRYAAILLLPICAAAYLFLHHTSQSVPETPESVSLVAQRKQPLLTLADGSVMALDTDVSTLHVIEGNIVHSGGSISYEHYHPARPAVGQSATPITAPAAAATPVYNTLTIPDGGDYRVVLADGTTVYLNEKSILRYPAEFLGTTREVYLIKGEMFFDVARNPAHPFVVHTDGGDIRVLGTQFNVSSGDQITTTLVSGNVEIRSAGLRVQLVPSQQAVFGGGAEEIRVRGVDDMDEVTCWKDNVFYFNDKSLDFILSKVASWYGFDVCYAEAGMKNQHYYIYIDKYADIRTILKSIAQAGSLRFRIEHNTIIVD